MNVSDFKAGSEEKLKQFNYMLEQLYGLKIDFDASEAHLREVFAHYIERKSLYLKENTYGISSPEFSKIVLITEAIRIFLKEIAPKRRKKSRRTTK
jgi:uncharacterized FlgJ-related protein